MFVAIVKKKVFIEEKSKKSSIRKVVPKENLPKKGDPNIHI
jgi:hypothetical protein